MEYSINNFFGCAKHEYDHDVQDGLLHQSNAYYYGTKKECDKALEAMNLFYEDAFIYVREYPDSNLPYEILVVEEVN